MHTSASVPGRKAFVRGKIYTVNPGQPVAEAVVVEKGKIVFVGSSEAARRFMGGDTAVIDLDGKLVLPGFIDNHVHFTYGGMSLKQVDLRPARSIPELQRTLREYASSHKGMWIIGGNWDHEAWENPRLPSKDVIDDFTGDTPVFVERFDEHMGLANSCALRLAGITRDTPTPEGGVIVKDPDTKEPTGILKNQAMNLVYAVIPPPGYEETFEAALRALQEARENGVTGVHDITRESDLPVYRSLEEKGLLTCRIYARTPIANYEELLREKIQAGCGSDKLKLGSLKAFADGSLGSSTAWFFDPYAEDVGNHGLPMDLVIDGRLERWAIDADRQRLQLSIHAIGDRANAWVLDLYELIREQNPAWDRRFRIEHAQHVRWQDIPRFAGIGVLASAQPYHAIEDGAWAEKRIGKQRTKSAYPFKSFLENSVHLCFGSDWPIAPLNPILGIYAAVTRRTLDGKNPDGWIPEQKISVADAIRCYTMESAWAAFEEKSKGSIEVGKLADMVVLADDILAIDPAKICEAKVAMTVVGGEIVFHARG